MNSVPDIFDILGGPTSVAALLCIKVSTAGEMKRRRVIPLKHWPALIEALEAKGCTIDAAALVAMHLKDAA